MKFNQSQFLKLKLANMTYWKASYIDFHFETNSVSELEPQKLACKTIETLHECNFAMAKNAINIKKCKSMQLKRQFIENFSDNKAVLQHIITTLGPEFSKELVDSEFNKHSKESAEFIHKYIDFYQDKEKKLEYTKN